MATYTRRENGRGEVTLEKKEKPGRASVGGRRGKSERKVVLKKVRMRNKHFAPNADGGLNSCSASSMRKS